MANKKSFADDISPVIDPAMNFITQPENTTVESTTEEIIKKEAAPTQMGRGKPPKGYKHNPLYIETKSRRLQLLIQPSLHSKLKDRATSENTSINELIHSILEKAIK